MGGRGAHIKVSPSSLSSRMGCTVSIDSFFFHLFSEGKLETIGIVRQNNNKERRRDGPSKLKSDGPDGHLLASEGNKQVKRDDWASIPTPDPKGKEQVDLLVAHLSPISSTIPFLVLVQQQRLLLLYNRYVIFDTCVTAQGSLRRAAYPPPSSLNIVYIVLYTKMP